VRFLSRFYGIVDASARIPPVELARLMLDSGVRTVQLRLKGEPTRDFIAAARAIAGLCRPAGATLIVNDRLDIAMLAEAHGTHLGQDDLPLEAGRRLAGPAHLFGISTHSLAQAIAAEAQGADYIGFGPIFTGGTKGIRVGQGLAAIREVRSVVKIPIVAIGGITEATAGAVIEAGADAAAIISDVLNSFDIGAKCRSLLKTLDGDV
jgi:thiamine-phosphate pyrophosphorylase